MIDGRAREDGCRCLLPLGPFRPGTPGTFLVMILPVILRSRRAKFLIVLAALGACTPIAPSFYKATRGGNLGGSTVPGDGSQSVAAVQVLIFDSRIEGEDNYRAALTAVVNPYVMIHFSPETNSSAFERFRSQGHLAVPMGSVLPEEVTVHIKLGLSDFDIHSLGLDEVKTILKPGAEGQWILSIREGTDPGLSHAVLNHLEAITVVMKPSGSTLAP